MFMSSSLAPGGPWHPGQRIAIFCHMQRVIVVAYEGVQTLDMTGPAEVFAAAQYRVEFAAVGGGEITTSSGLHVRCRDLSGLRPQRGDIVVVAGADEPPILHALADRALLDWLVRASKVVRRLTSVCSGAFILA